ncbi:MAG: L-2-amino-thiazoline-4-carboxylic acid hydrolase [Chloroflexota bacterium]
MGKPEDIESRTIPKGEALEQILVTVERLAMLHYHFAATLVAELGEDRGRELVARAIASYGREVGERHRRRVIEAGFEPSCENFKAVSDLPTLAWSPEGMPVAPVNGERRRVCPMAKYWIEKGAEELGRLYCGVDQAKYVAFDPECECRHLKNVLDGDEQCQVVAKKRSEWNNIDGGAL